MVDKGDVDAALIKRDRLSLNGSFIRPRVARVRLSQPSFASSVSPFSMGCRL